ncbi:EamA family transporter RarD [Microbacteriaceae bacterium 4G12]
MEQQLEQRKGMIYAVISYVIWGVLPIYWKLVDQVNAGEILAHRIVWSFVFMIFVLYVSKQWGAFLAQCKQLFRRPKPFILLFLSAILISGNWFIYIWAVNHGHVIEASLGYYMNPLISILLGMIILKEKLNFWQLASVLLAAIGVAIVTLRYGSFPWIAIALAVSFGLYGLVKKLTSFEAAIGLTFETLITAPIAFVYLIMLQAKGASAFGTTSLSIHLLLIGSGIVTATPLLYFAKGTKLIPLSMIGFLQYIAPTISLVIGVFMFHEHFTKMHMIAFVFIWIALVIFSLAKTKFMLGIEPKLRKTKTAKAS